MRWLLACVLLLAFSDQWPQFRGPQSLGVAEGDGLPETWGATENVAWKTAIPGVGWSAPFAWGGRVFVTSVINSGETEPPKKGLYFGGERPASQAEHRWMVYCLDWRAGKGRWGRESPRGARP